VGVVAAGGGAIRVPGATAGGCWAAIKLDIWVLGCWLW